MNMEELRNAIEVYKTYKMAGKKTTGHLDVLYDAACRFYEIQQVLVRSEK